jgi:hypothetical protein
MQVLIRLKELRILHVDCCLHILLAVTCKAGTDEQVSVTSFYLPSARVFLQTATI